MTYKKIILSNIALGLGLINMSFANQSADNTKDYNIFDSVTNNNSVNNKGLPITPSLAPMLKNVIPAVVSINVEGVNKYQRSRNPLFDDLPEEFRQFFGQNILDDDKPRQRKFMALGSGAIINAKQGYVITNNHVVDNSDKITVQLNDGREFLAKVVGTDPKTDVAVIKIDKPEKLAEIKLGNSDSVEVGDFAVAIGNPFGIGQSVTYGVVSAVGRATEDGNALQNFIQTDASINQGNSGGPLVNLQGELIGINTAIATPSGGSVGIAFAIPSNMVQSISDQIIHHGKVNRAMAGIKGVDYTAELAKHFKSDVNQGAFVSEVVKDSPADKAGLQAGDVIVAIDNSKITSFNMLRTIILSKAPGEKVKLEIIRNNANSEVEVVLGAESKLVTNNNEVLNEKLAGLELKDYKKGDISGVEVTNTNKQSQRLDIKKGDIIVEMNNNKINSVEELSKQIKDVSDDIIALHILRNDTSLYIILK